MAKDYRRLWKDVAGASNEGGAVRTLAEILLDKEGRAFISNLERNDAELCIKILDRGLAEHDLKATEKHAFSTVLRRLAATHGRLPDSMMIEEIAVSGEILASGGFADVRTGMYGGRLVAVKTMRVAKQDDSRKIRKQFCKEVVLWNTLSHPNVLKLIGVHRDIDKGQFTTVSEWMIHGNIMEFIRKNHVNRLELLHGVAQGLSYLHDRAGLIHGDLKGANILMSNESPPRACLADFGFMAVVLDPSQPMSCSAQLEGGTLMFMSPELLVPSKFGFTESKPTPEADVYAFGLVIHQVLTGELPFPRLGVAEIAVKVVEGVRPTKPENASTIGFSDSLWSFARRCWDHRVELRPKITEAVSQLERAVTDWDRVMPPCAQAEGVASTSLGPVSDSTAHRGIFFSSAVPESSAVSQTTPTSSDPPSIISTGYIEPPSAEALEVATKPPGEPDLAFEMPHAADEDDCNPQHICAPPLQGHSPYNTPPQPNPPTASSSHCSDADGVSLSTAAVPSNLFDRLKPDVIEAEDENLIKENNTRNRSATRTDHPTKESPAAKKQDASETSTVGESTSPTEIPGFPINEAPTKSKKGSIWHRFKQFVRSVSV